MAINTLFLTGFEHGFIATGSGAAAGGGLIDTLIGTTGVTCPTTIPRNGARYLQVAGSISEARGVRKNIGTQTKLVERFALRTTVRPSGPTDVAWLENTTPAIVARIRISDTGVLTAELLGGTAQTGPTINMTAYHLIELQYDATAKTLDWKVDGVSQTQATTASTLTNVASVGFGTTLVGQPGAQVCFDDWIVGTWTNAATDWYGDGKVLAQPAGVDGTHATITSLSPGDAGTAYSGTPTTINTMVDDPPGTLGWTATRSTTDNVALRTATAGAYAAIGPAVTAETGQANEVRAIMSYSSPATGANLAACDVRNSAGTVTELWGLTGGVGKAYNIVANQFKAGIVTKPAAGWTAAEVNAIRFRFGGCTSADINPVPTVQAMMLEVDWPVSVPTTYNDSGSGTITASGTATESAAYNDTATGTITATGSGAETYEPPAAVYTDTQTGTTTATGTSTESATAADTATGAITATGTGADSWAIAYTDTADGTATASGTSTESAAGTNSRTGVITATGAALESAAHTDTQTATATASGTGVDSWTLGYTDTATGVITSSGTSLETAAYDDTQTAAPALTGTGSETYQPPAGDTTYTDDTTGTLTTTGTALENAAATDDLFGTATAAGTSTDAHTRDTAATGELAATGTSLENATANDARTATATASGTATEHYQPPAVHADTAAGTIAATGAALDTHTHTGSATGRIITTGTASETAATADTQTGNLNLTTAKTENAAYTDQRTTTVTTSGTAIESMATADTRAGTTTTTGTGTETRTGTDTQTGTTTTTGTRNENHTHTSPNAGTITYVGTGTDLWQPAGPQHQDTATGQATASGTSLELRTYHDTQDGDPTAHGTSQHATTYTDTCPGTIRTHGTSRQRLRIGHLRTRQPHPSTPGILRRHPQHTR